MMTALAIAFVLWHAALCALATAAASAAHGGEYGRKGYVMALHFLAAPLVAPVFWLAFRRGVQAKAELDYYSGKGGEDAIVAAYYIRPLGKLMARVMRYCLNNPWPHLTVGDPHDGRRKQQEYCGGFVLGWLGGSIFGIIVVGILWLS